jgi:hypothetical protein
MIHFAIEPFIKAEKRWCKFSILKSKAKKILSTFVASWLFKPLV